jgi:hypothetical protein
MYTLYFSDTVNARAIVIVVRTLQTIDVDFSRL